MKTILLLALTFSIVSCSTTGSVSNSAEFSQKACVSAPAKDVWEFSKLYMTANQFEVAEQRDADMFISGKTGWSAFSSGEYLGIQVSDLGGKTQIAYKSAKAVKTQIAAKNWEDELRKELTLRYSSQSVSCL